MAGYGGERGVVDGWSAPGPRWGEARCGRAERDSVVWGRVQAHLGDQRGFCMRDGSEEAQK